MEISKSNGWKCCKSEIVQLKNFISFVHIIEAITRFEVAICCSTLWKCQVTHDVFLNLQDNLKEHTKEKTDTCNDNEKSESLEDEPSIKELLDFSIIG